MNVHLVGCGFLGSLFGEELAKWSKALKLPMSWGFYDPDVVSERNVANQLWSPADIGLGKAEALADRVGSYMGADWEGNLQVHPERVDESRLQWLKDANVIVCAVDNVPTRQLLWKFSIASGIPLMSVGISQEGTGNVDWTSFVHDVDTNPFSLAQPQTTEEIEAATKLAQLPPCELISFRGLGLNMAVAATKAMLILDGWDPEGVVMSPKQRGPTGTFTTWQASQHGHSLLQVFTAKED